VEDSDENPARQRETGVAGGEAAARRRRFVTRRSTPITRPLA